MAKTLTATDRSALIRLASTMEKGSEERKAILAGLKKVATISVPSHFRSRGDLRKFLMQHLPGYKIRTKITNFSHGSMLFIKAKAPDGFDFGGNVFHKDTVEAYPEYFAMTKAWPERPAPTLDDRGETYKVNF